VRPGQGEAWDGLLVSRGLGTDTALRLGRQCLPNWPGHVEGTEATKISN
jgi:hypothetical protein